MPTRTDPNRLGQDPDDAPETNETTAADTAQKGGSRGTSNTTGPARGTTRNSRTAIAGTDQGEQGPQKSGGTADPIRGPLPPGTVPEDYVGGERPHKTRSEGGEEKPGAKKNEVV